MSDAGVPLEHRLGEADVRRENRRDLNVLCVDDHASFLMTLRRVFEADGWRVAAVETASAARNAALGAQFDFMVIDLKLPDSSGLELVQDLVRAGVTTPALIITAYPDPKSAILATRLHADYIDKSDLTPSGLVAFARTRVSTSNASDAVHKLLLTTAARVATPPTESDGRIVGHELARAIVGREITFVDFMTLAEALRSLLRPGSVGLPIADQLRFLADRRPGRRRIAQATGLERLFQNCFMGSPHWTKDATKPTRMAVAGLDWSARLIGRAVGMRCAAVELAATSEQIAQICYHLGYDHHAAFDRDFLEFFGSSPTRFRRLVRPDRLGTPNVR